MLKKRKMFKILIQGHGLTQKRFCKKTGISQSTVSKLCKDDKFIRKLSLERVEYIANFLNFTLQQLLNVLYEGDLTRDDFKRTT